MKKLHNRPIALLLAVMMFVTILPVSAVSDGSEPVVDYSEPARLPELSAAEREVTFRAFDNRNVSQLVEERVVEAGSPLGQLPQAPERPGFTFVGWLNPGTGFVTEETAVDRDMVIEASYRADYPAFRVEGQNAGVTAYIDAPEGALPEDTLFRMIPVDGETIRDKVQDALGGEVGEIRAVDMTFVKRSTRETIQPNLPVTVTMTLTEVQDKENLSVIHIRHDGEAEVIPHEMHALRAADSARLSFEADSFSIYAVTPGIDPFFYRRTYNFEDIIDPPDSTFSPYQFYNKNGEQVTCQILKDGDTLDEIPTPFHMGYTFDGWYLWDEAAGTYGEKIDFTTPMDLSALTGDDQVTVRSRYTGVYYVNFHEYDEDHDPDVILTTRVTDSEGNLRVDDVLAPQPDAVHIFTGWVKDGTVYDIYDANKHLVETTLTFTEDGDVYPHFVEAFWLRFSSGPQASYIPAEFVEVDERVTTLPVPTRRGYTFMGWYHGTEDEEGAVTYGDQVSDGNGSVLISGGLTINKETTLYAQWAPNNATTYTVVIWKQKVTDSKTAADSAKTYDYEASEVRTGVTGTPAESSQEDRSHNYTGFHYARTVISPSDTIQANGSTVVNVYYDRDLMAVNFYYQNGHQPSGAHTSYTYTATTGDSGTQYGVDTQGNYYELRKQTTTTTQVYYTYTSWFQQYRYYGTFYTRSGRWPLYRYTATQYNGDNLPPNNNKTYYTEDHDELTRHTETTTETHWTMNGQPYYGTRYTRSSVSDYPYMVTWTGLYGQSFEQNGYSWPSGYRWNEERDGSGTTQTFLSAFNKQNPYNLYDRGSTGSSVIYHYKQALDGRYYQNEDTYRFTVYGSGGTFYFENKFDGFNVQSYNTGNNGYNRNGGSNTDVGGTANSYPLHVYHTRVRRKIDYVSDGAVVHTENNIYYETPLNGQADQTIHFAGGKDYNLSLSDVGLPERDHYTFTGWYADATCTTHFNFNGTMPNANVAVYAGWEKNWYQIIVDPDGGEINNSADSTYFWKQYQDTFDRYSVTRNYIEDPDGEYKYVYVDGRLDPEGDVPAAQRRAYYTLAEDGYTGKRYRLIDPAVDPTYAFVGWYVVDANGHTTTTPYDFDAEVEAPVTIRAVWRLDGDYGLVYDPTMRDGDTVIASGQFTQTAPEARYADNAVFVIQRGPSDITSQYVFDGWEIVNPETGAVLDDNGGAYYQPGEEVNMRAGNWARNKTVTLRAHYTHVEQSTDPVETTFIKFDANGGTFADGVMAQYEAFNDPTNSRINAVINGSKDLISITGLHLNADPVTPTENMVSRENYVFLGWALSAGATEKVFDGGQQVAADNLDRTEPNSDNTRANTLYAVWDSNKIKVHKTPVAMGDLPQSDITHTIYYAVADRFGNFLKDRSGNVIIKSIAIQAGVAGADVVFDGIPEGDFEVYELNSADETDLLIRGQIYTNPDNGHRFQVSKILGTSWDGTSGNNASLPAVTDDDFPRTANVSFENHYTVENTITGFHARKRWQDRHRNVLTGDSIPEGATATFGLYRQVSGGQIEPALDDDDQPLIITVDGTVDETGEDEAWEAFFENLPVLDPDGRHYIYMVKELARTPNYFFPMKDDNNEADDNYYMRLDHGYFTNRDLSMNIKLQKHFDFQPNSGYGALTYDQFRHDKETQALLGFTLTLPDGTTRTFDLSEFDDTQNTQFELLLENMLPGEYTLTENNQDHLLDKYHYYYEGGTPGGTTTKTFQLNKSDQTPLGEIEIDNNYRQGQKIKKAQKIIDGDLERAEYQTAGGKLRTLHFLIRTGDEETGYKYFVRNLDKAYWSETDGAMETAVWTTDPEEAGKITLTNLNYNWSGDTYRAEANLQQDISLFPGTYELIELEAQDGTADMPGYDLTVGGTLEITKGFDSIITVTNTYNKKPVGSLTVSKTVSDPDGKAPAGQTFTFTVTLDKALEDDYAAPQGAARQAGTEETPTVYTFTLTDGGNITFEGLPAGAAYTVTEGEPAAGFCNVTEGMTDGALTGLIVKDETAEAAFTNLYSETEAQVRAKKELKYRDWQDSDTFTMSLAAEGDATQAAIAAGTVVLPEETEKAVTSATADLTAVFDAITFKAEGVFTFRITENASGITGVTDSKREAVAQVTVTRDPVSKALTAAVAYKSEKNDKGEAVTEDYSATVPTFVNIYDTEGTFRISGTKTFRQYLESTDSYLTLTPADGQFTFSVSAADGVPVPASATTGNTGDGFTFGDITVPLSMFIDEFGDMKNVPEPTLTFEYTVREVIPDTAKTVDGKKIDGDVIYDTGVRSVTVKMTYSRANGQITLKEITQPASVVFNNTKETRPFTATKIWDDQNDAFSLRPAADDFAAALVLSDGSAAVTVPESPAEGQPSRALGNTAGSNWTITYHDLPKYRNGQEIVYSLTENGPFTGYDAPVYSDTDRALDGGSITNTLTTGDLDVTKASQTLPEAFADKDFTFTVRYGEKYLKKDASTGKVTLSDSEVTYTVSKGETVSFTGLPAGSYTVTEDTALAAVTNYTLDAAASTTSGTASVTKSETPQVFTLVNEYTVDTVDLTAIKVWQDDGTDQTKAARPALTLTLSGKYNDGENDVDATIAQDARTRTIPAASENNATAQWTDLPVAENGYEITYAVTETLPEDSGYSKSEGTVQKDPETGSFTVTITNTREGNASISGSKVWLDGGRTHDNTADLTLMLYRQTGATPEEEVTEDLNGAAVAPVWTQNAFTYNNNTLPQYDSLGRPYTYYVRETAISDGVTDHDKYVTTYRNSGDSESVTDRALDGGVITNKLVDETQITGHKVWLDVTEKTHDNEAEIALNLYRQSAKADSRREAVTDAEQFTLSWVGNDFSFEALSKYDDEGYLYTYSVEETQVMGYAAPVYVNTGDSAAVTDMVMDGGTVRNIELKDVVITKEWVEPNGKTRFRPTWDEFKAMLTLTDETAGEAVEKEPTSDASGSEWEITFSGLPAFTADGSPIVYHVTEEEVENYRRAYRNTGDNSGVRDKAYDGGTITNTILRVDVDVKKVISGNVADLDKLFTFTFPGNTLVDLGNNDTETITDLTVGATVTVSEVADGYTAVVTQTGLAEDGTQEGSLGNVSYTFVVPEAADEKAVITFTNTYNLDVETGVETDSLPYLMILALVALCGAALLIRRRREDV